ncbi:hypothetical protein FEFB_04510 [Fructobacillus sp. EFB-N1]|uniref:hypothetical protein n=1 Tax=Fructobacillus sp. EFB-N1 TaxID=1658766 RepID=UPI00065CD2BB|nr:hypothetical protein [Fructobacillus sp. EFB-N1]KMK53853.1 hypothetical protein FEFB_04510 [Fructobacillus sp. EFB-N1]
MKKAQKKTSPESLATKEDDLSTMPFLMAIWLYFNMKNTQTVTINGFYSPEVANIEGRQYSPVDHLRNHLIFLKRLIGTLEPDTKAFYMVDMQIANLTADIEEV